MTHLPFVSYILNQLTPTAGHRSAGLGYDDVPLQAHSKWQRGQRPRRRRWRAQHAPSGVAVVAIRNAYCDAGLAGISDLERHLSALPSGLQDGAWPRPEPPASSVRQLARAPHNGVPLLCLPTIFQEARLPGSLSQSPWPGRWAGPKVHATAVEAR